MFLLCADNTLVGVIALVVSLVDSFIVEASFCLG